MHFNLKDFQLNNGFIEINPIVNLEASVLLSIYSNKGCGFVS